MMSVFTQEQATDMILKEKYKEGLEYGLEQGLERGVAVVARSLRDSGTDMELIIKCTGLTKEQILKL